MKQLVKHLKTNRIGEIIKENPKTFLVKTLEEGYETIYEDILWKKQDVESYIEPIKEKSFYEKMKERNMEDAKNLPTTPKAVSQNILWLKAAILDRVEKIENRTNDDIRTFRDSITDKLGFTEEYVNILMQMAYDEGYKLAEERVEEELKNRVLNMGNALNKIKDALDDADWIDRDRV